jgi:hypothetical protein
LNGLLLVDNPMISAGTLVMAFPSARSVSAFFGSTSTEFEVADVYFAGYNNKFTAPKQFYVARRIAEDAAAWLRSARNVKTLTAFKAIADGAFTISVDSTARNITALDFSGATSFSDVATIIQAGITTAGATGVAVTYSSLTGAFTITSGTAGASSEVSFAGAPASGTDLAAFMGLTEALGAVISPGVDAMTEAEQMQAILDKTQNFVSFTTAWECDPDEALAWSSWANANYGWLYVGYSAAAVMTSADSTIDMASAIKTAGYDHTAVIYGSVDYAAFIMGVVASIAWQRVNGTITAAFKRQTGLAPWVVDEMTASVLEAKNCNYFGNFATRNAEFIFLYPGCLSASDYGYIDPYVNSIWLNNRIQVALMDCVTLAGKVPFNTRGYTMIKAWLADPVNQALLNGCIEAGVTLNERQRSEVMNEAGLDISAELWTAGYYVQVLDPGPEVRARRDSPIVSLWYTYGGAVQRIEVASTAIL